jgi:hypothetical protein
VLDAAVFEADLLHPADAVHAIIISRQLNVKGEE